MTAVTPEHRQPRLVVRVLLQIGEATYHLGDADMRDALSTMRALLAPALSSEAVSPALHERLATLCTRLGEPFPPVEQLDQHTAAALLARLEGEEEELLRTAEGAHAASSAALSSSPVDKGLVRQLKARWRMCVGTQELLRAWDHFKQRVCAETVVDRAMRTDQYEKLLAALASLPQERTS